MKDMLKSGLSIEHLYTLLVVARKKSFLEAAKELGIVQSTVSIRIAALEKAFGVKIFKRTLGGVSITDDGLAVLDAVKSSLGILEEAEKKLKSKETKPQKATISVATCFTAGIYVLPRLVKEAEKELGLNSELVILDTGRVINKLKRGEVNFICFGSRGYKNPYVHDRCDFIPIAQDELVVVAPRANELSGREEVTIKEIKKYPFVAPMRHTEAYSEINAMSTRIKYALPKLSVVTELESAESIILAVANRLGISILPSLPVKEMSKYLPVEPVKISRINARRTFYLGCLKGENQEKQVKSFWDFVKYRRPFREPVLQNLG